MQIPSVPQRIDLKTYSGFTDGVPLNPGNDVVSEVRTHKGLLEGELYTVLVCLFIPHV